MYYLVGELNSDILVIFFLYNTHYMYITNISLQII